MRFIFLYFFIWLDDWVEYFNTQADANNYFQLIVTVLYKYSIKIVKCIGEEHISTCV